MKGHRVKHRTEPRARPAGRRLRDGARAWALVWGLALALLAAQMLGLAHRVTHGGPADHGPAPSTFSTFSAVSAVSAVSTVSTVSAESAHRHGLFDGHAPGDAECRLLDALCADGTTPVAVAALPPRPSTEAPATAQGPAAPRHPVAAYLARAPPALERNSAPRLLRG